MAIAPGSAYSQPVLAGFRHPCFSLAVMGNAQLKRAGGRISALAIAAMVATCAGSERGRAEDRQGVAARFPIPDMRAAMGDHWFDGKAELSGYRLRFPRYGQLRDGTAVTIFVTEPQWPKTRVKPEGDPTGAFPVMKLNWIQDFQTGIYDYNLMTSVFVTTAPALGQPAGVTSKVSTSVQEWCGHAYSQALFDADAVRITSHSYFDGEADQRLTLARTEPALTEDALLHWARGLAAPAVAAGEQTAALSLLRSLEHVRLAHVPFAFDRVRLRRAAALETTQVPAGRFQVRRASADITRSDGTTRSWTFFVEEAPPRRLVRVMRDDGLAMELLGQKRLAYWQLNQEGHEAHLQDIGLGRLKTHSQGAAD